MERQDNARSAVESGCGCSGSRSEPDTTTTAKPADDGGCCIGSSAQKHGKQKADGRIDDQAGCCGGTLAGNVAPHGRPRLDA